jgi:hypothetical protein
MITFLPRRESKILPFVEREGHLGQELVPTGPRLDKIHPALDYLLRRSRNLVRTDGCTFDRMNHKLEPPPGLVGVYSFSLDEEEKTI